MGFKLKKIIKKAKRVVTLKSRTTRKLAIGAAIVSAPFIIGGTASALFGARGFLQNSEQNQNEIPAERAEFELGPEPPPSRGFLSLFTSPSARTGAVATAAGASTSMCSVPAIVETVCRFCGG